MVLPICQCGGFVSSPGLFFMFFFFVFFFCFLSG